MIYLTEPWKTDHDLQECPDSPFTRKNLWRKLKMMYTCVSRIAHLFLNVLERIHVHLLTFPRQIHSQDVLGLWKPFCQVSSTLLRSHSKLTVPTPPRRPNIVALPEI